MSRQRLTSLGVLILLGVSSTQAQKSIRERFLRLGSGFRRELAHEEVPEQCEAITVNFDQAADGTPLSPPLCVENEWAELGLTLFAEGGEGSLPCIFDTANPGDERNGGDSDLGAPNEGCTPSGPGTGVGGAPGQPGENCDPLGNVLIVQEPGVDVPDDNVDGGILTLDFPAPGGQYVYEIGLLDIDYATSVIVVYEKDESGELAQTEINVPLLGDNSKQTVLINQDRGEIEDKDLRNAVG